MGLSNEERGSVPGGAIYRDDAPGKYATRTELVTERQRKLGASKVTTPEETAHAFAYLGKGAVEHFDALVTDKNGLCQILAGTVYGGQVSCLWRGRFMKINPRC
jgi:hypothetical protein